MNSRHPMLAPGRLVLVVGGSGVGKDTLLSRARGVLSGDDRFVKNQDKHPFPDSVQENGLTIGGVHYSAADLETILNRNGGNAVAILGKQLVGALLNLAAGAKHNPTADGAIATAETLLEDNSLNLLTSSVGPSTTLGQALLVQENILDRYNNGNFHTCSDGSGLTLGD